MRTTVYLPDDLLARAKQKAAEEGRTLTSMIEEGLTIVVAGRPKAADRRKRTLPRVSTAGGGLHRGIDPVKIVSATEELDDIDRLARIGAR